MILQFADLRSQAENRLHSAPYSPRRLVLIHTAVSLGASLVIFLLTLLFEQLIANTGGLGSMGTRSMLQTAQALLAVIEIFILPFWNIGITRAALLWARGELAEPPTLLEGFRRFRSILGLFLLLFVILLGLSIVVSQIVTTLFMLTPFAGDLIDAQNLLLENFSILSPEIQPSDETIAQYLSATKPLTILSVILFAAGAILVLYRIRFAGFAVMDGGRSLISLFHSFRITKKKALEIFKLDLHFWWFYLLQALSVALCYGDSILAALGIQLPISAELSYVLFYAVGILCQGLLLWCCQARVSATYALAYDALSAENPLTMDNG